MKFKTLIIFCLFFSKAFAWQCDITGESFPEFLNNKEKKIFFTAQVLKIRIDSTEYFRLKKENENIRERDNIAPIRDLGGFWLPCFVTLKVIDKFFGDVEDTVTVKLEYGCMNPGSQWLVYSFGKYNGYYVAGGHCDFYTREIKENDELTLNRISHLKSISEIIKGKKTEILTLFYPDKKIAAQGKYIKGKLEGTWKYYYPDGKLKSGLHYKKGNLEGQSYYFFENGNIKSIVDFKNDKVSSSTSYLEKFQNKISHKTTYRYFQDHYTYEFNEFHENGVLLRIDNYKILPNKSFGGQYLEGIHKTYYPNSNLKEAGVFKEGVKLGEWKYYKENGDLSEKIDYGNNYPSRSYISYDNKLFTVNTIKYSRFRLEIYFSNGNENGALFLLIPDVPDSNATYNLLSRDVTLKSKSASFSMLKEQVVGYLYNLPNQALEVKTDSEYIIMELNDIRMESPESKTQTTISGKLVLNKNFSSQE